MIEKKIIKIIKSIIKSNIDLKKNKNLIKEQVLDSFGIIVLISSLEKEFKFKINMNKFEINNFKNLSQIKKFILKNNKKR